MIFNTYCLRNMLDKDLEQVYNIECKSFISPWSKENFKFELMENEFAHYLVVYKCNQPDIVLGYCGLWLFEEEAHIPNIAILHKYRGKHLGEILINEIKLICKKNGVSKIYLKVSVSNQSALSLYLRLGFYKIELLNHFYETGENALTLCCDL